MDTGEIEPLPHPDDDLSGNFQNSDEFLDEFLNDNSRTCTHTHTCNPSGPDSAHTHTCFHTHTKVFTFSDETAVKNSKRPLGNREAVRKYREKKKAHTAYLEEEVKKLRALNQQLVRKLQGLSVLESEISRLRSLLFDIGGKIDNYPFQKQCFDDNGCGVQCDSPRLQSNIIGSSSQMDMNGKGRVLDSWDDQDCQNAVLECRIQGSNGAIG